PNPDQADADGDGRGDVCDVCPADPANDADGDGICGNLDNCPTVANASQVDADRDGIGDACDSDADGDGVQDASEPCCCLGTAPGVPTTALGCSIDQICPCAAPLGSTAWNHGEYLHAVKQVVKELLVQQRITTVDRRTIVSAAKASGCGN